MTGAFLHLISDMNGASDCKPHPRSKKNVKEYKWFGLSQIREALQCRTPVEVRSPSRPVPANLRISIWFVHQVSKGKQPTFSTNAACILERPEEGSTDLLMEELMGRRDGTVDARHDDDPSSASNLSLHVPARSCIHRWFYTKLGLSEPTLEDPSLMKELMELCTKPGIAKQIKLLL